METILAYAYSFLLAAIVLKAFFSKNRAELFSPIVFFAVYYAYYILVPYFTSKEDLYGGRYNGTSLLLFAAIVNIMAMLIGYNCYKPNKGINSNNLYTLRNGKYLGVCLLFIGSLSYFVYNGFNINVVAVQTEFYDATEHRLGHSEQYITMLISLLPAAACLFYAIKANRLYFILTIVVATIIGVMGGSRYRLFMFYIPLVTFYHLYPKPRKINYKVWIPAAVFFVFAMGVIEKTRNYGSGLDLERMTELFSDNSRSTKASETELVYYFSAKVMDAYQNEMIIPGEVFGTALCLPIPRAIYKSKPDGQYLRDANIKTLGTDAYGAAYLNIVEWYLALGWIGVFLNGLFLGMLSKYFWNNFMCNSDSIGAALYLSMYNGICYILVSRGYLAQEYVMFVYYVPMIYWISKLLVSFRYKFLNVKG